MAGGSPRETANAATCSRSKASRTKGAAGERELARIIRTAGFACERTGRNGRTSEDVTHDIPGVHLEAKRREALAIPAWVRQAERDAGEGLVPVVAFRQSRQPWRVVLPLDELLRLKWIERMFADRVGQIIDTWDAAA